MQNSYFFVGIDIPEICVGGFCIIPNPFGGCILRAPRVCVFSDDPDIQLTLPLSGLIRHEVSFTGSLNFDYFVNPARPAGMDDWTAAEADPSLSNQWQLRPIPVQDRVGSKVQLRLSLVCA